jgi:hypothetical protein
MGNRAWIEVSAEQFETPVSFYGHWSGEDNLTAVKNVLERTQRIGDVSYLSAQIFFEFTSLAQYTGDTGFGISTGEAPSVDDVDTVYVNADTGEYTYQGETHREFALSKV